MIRIKDLKIMLNENLEEKVIEKLKVSKNNIKDIKIVKKSLDARRKILYYNYTLDVDLDINIKPNNKDIFSSPIENYIFKIKGSKLMKNRPVIVGCGPSGLFCAYMLSKYGYRPIIIERGENIDNRIKSVNEFWEKGTLNINSNVCFGEGGAGTFSDGKLNTLVKDKNFLQKKVFEIFVENGAPKEIMYEKNPHIGTDILYKVIKNIRNKIIDFKGEIRFNTCLTNLIIKDDKLVKIELNNKEIIPCDNLVLALGHSARDTFKMLYKNNIKMESKDFSVGIRIMHPQELINKVQYKEYYKILPPANYKLTYKTKDKRGVYSFCMCPGGYVVNSSSEKGKLVINGMSNYKRESSNANSALVVTVSKKDYGFNLFDGMHFQEQLEKKAFEEGKGKIPVQTLIDFYDNKKTTKLGKIKPLFKGQYCFSNINDILPSYICESLKEAIINFDTKIKGFKENDAIISAVESRTSSPIRILRDETFNSNIKGIYPIGEGAGYAGGITTSSMDGIRVAEKIAEVYKGVLNE